MTRFTMLAVDDDPNNLHIIGEVFKREPINLSYAASGEHALEMLSDPKNAFDVVLLDRMMTGLDGIAVLRRMKAEPRLAHTPVVMQTAAAAPEEVSEGLSAGAHYYLTKPYAPATLRTIIRSALDYVRDRRELEARAGINSEALALLDEARFFLRTADQAQRLAVFLAQLCPDPKLAVLGLSELLMNAIEHGNLGITCNEKSALMREDRLNHEIVRRLQLPAYRERRATVEVKRSANELKFTVTDQGDGFDYRAYLELDPSRAFEPNGRGIALARKVSFTQLSYQGKGNIVVATVATIAMRASSSTDSGAEH
jgi:CheY-like chemotaxis protein